MSTTLDQLLAAAQAAEEGRGAAAEALLAGLLEPALLAEGPERRLAHLFATSLQARVRGDQTETGNLYQHEADPDAMLAAFQTLVGATPFIRFGYGAANAALAQALAEPDAIHLIDIGIGAGTQWPPLIDALAARPSPPRLLRITGIDVAAAGPDPDVRLQAVGQMLRRHADARGLQLSFDFITAQVEHVDLSAIERTEGAALAINAAFALHHIPAGDGVTDEQRSRDALLTRLLALEPHILTLVEPDSEHNALPVLERIPQAHRHYGAVFHALAAYLPDDKRERRIIEQSFFGREIRNVVVGEGPARVERHERHAAWGARMTSLGFHQLPLDVHAAAIADRLNIVHPASILVDEGMLVLTWDGTPLVAASAWS